MAATVLSHTRTLAEMTNFQPELLQVVRPPTAPGEVYLEGLIHFTAALPTLERAKEILEGGLGNSLELIRLISHLVETNNTLAAWEEQVPETRKPIEFPNDPSVYTAQTTPYPPTPFLQKLTAYADFGHVGLWCAHWSGRIQILRVMMLCLARLEEQGSYGLPLTDPANLICEPIPIFLSTPAIQQSLQLCVTEVCGMVPHMLGKLNTFTRSLDRSLAFGATEHKSTIAGSGRKPVKAIGAFFCLLTLFSAGLVTCVPYAQHCWILDRLLEIGNEIGIKQGLTLRQYLLDFHKGHVWQDY